MDNNIPIIDEGQRQRLSIAGSSYRIIVSGEETNGNYAVIDMLVPPGSGPNPHAHAGFQEMFYVVDGEVEFKMEGRKHLAKKGTLVNIPLGGVVHCFKNTSDQVAHLLCTVVPAGLDTFFREVGKPIEDDVDLPTPFSKEEMMLMKAIGEKYGQVFYAPDFLD